MTDWDDLGMSLLCDALQFGAFAGHRWNWFRRSLAHAPHLQNACHFICIMPEKFAISAKPPRGTVSEYHKQVCDVVASALEAESVRMDGGRKVEGPVSPGIAPCMLRAHAQFIEIVQSNPNLSEHAKIQEAYNLAAKRAKAAGDEIASFETWKRYLRHVARMIPEGG